MGAPFRYTAYGLTVRSNQPLPAPSGAGDTPFDLDIDISAAPVQLLEWDGPAPLYVGVESFWRLDDHTWRLGYTDANSGARWDLTCTRGERIRVRWMEGISIPDIRTFLLDSAVTVALHQRGTPCLHASGVVVGEQSALFMGFSGTGKSTTAAAMVAAGHDLLTDDVAALELGSDQVYVQPGHPRLRLLADSAAAVNEPFDFLPRVWTDPYFSDKRYLDASAAEGAQRRGPTRLGVIYVLADREPDRREPAITPLGPREALRLLMCHTRGGRWLDPPRRAWLFRSLARVTELVPVRIVHRGDSLSKLPELVDLLSDDVDRMSLRCPG